jgi:hypothetical protein
MSPTSATKDLRECSPTPTPEIVGEGAQTDLEDVTRCDTRDGT